MGLIAGGTGITPMYSIALASLLGRENLEIKLLYSNKTKNDILLKSELDNLAKTYPDRFQVFYTLTRHNANIDGYWPDRTGRVSYQMMKACGLPPCTVDTSLILQCGTPSFVDSVVEMLKENGYREGVHFV